MKKNLRVVQINGIRGLFLALFVIICLIAGFIAFPAFLTMHTWNYFAIKTGSFPSLSIGEGLLLWAIITLSAFIFNKKKFIVSFKAEQELTEDEVKEVISKIKTQTVKPYMILPKEFNASKENKEELNEITSESKEN